MGKLVCINPKEIRDYSLKFEQEGKDVEVGIFQIGVVPRKIMKLVSDEGGGSELDKMEMYIRHGVKGHKDLTYEDGTEVPFTTVENEDGDTVVSDDTLEVYRATGFIPQLSMEILSKGGGDRIASQIKEATVRARAKANAKVEELTEARALDLTELKQSEVEKDTKGEPKGPDTPS